jgi:hypothetical protein
MELAWLVAASGCCWSLLLESLILQIRWWLVLFVVGVLVFVGVCCLSKTQVVVAASD